MEKELSDYDFKSQLLEERNEKIEGRISNMIFNEEYHTKGRPDPDSNLIYGEHFDYVMLLVEETFPSGGWKLE